MQQAMAKVDRAVPVLASCFTIARNISNVSDRMSGGNKMIEQVPYLE